MEKEKLLISSCLLGNNVKYNGGNNILSEELLEKLKKRYELYACCPEVDGGLPTPRIPCEIISQDPLKVINKKNEEKTQQFVKGAQIALQICKDKNIKKALFKANSPSCSNKYIYDGSFTSSKVPGVGVAAQTLINNDVTVYNEAEIDNLFL